MMNRPPDWGMIALGFGLAMLVASGAFKLKWLSPVGTLAAFVLGWIVFGLGGWSWAFILIAFFASSNVLSFLFRRRKKKQETFYAKGGRRDAGQVLANGGLAGLFVLTHFFFSESTISWIGFCAALAAANADTWATELGVLNKTKPVLITTGKPVEAGTSGGISLTGILASAGGAFLIAGLGWLFHPLGPMNSTEIFGVGIIFFAGFIGSLVDSWLGAQFQAVYTCPQCQHETEQHPLHDCGSYTTLVRGQSWLNNDRVNFFCTLSASLLAVLVYVIFS